MDEGPSQVRRSPMMSELTRPKPRARQQKGNCFITIAHPSPPVVAMSRIFYLAIIT